MTTKAISGFFEKFLSLRVPNLTVKISHSSSKYRGSVPNSCFSSGFLTILTLEIVVMAQVVGFLPHTEIQIMFATLSFSPSHCRQLGDKPKNGNSVCLPSSALNKNKKIFFFQKICLQKQFQLVLKSYSLEWHCGVCSKLSCYQKCWYSICISVWVHAATFPI